MAEAYVFSDDAPTQTRWIFLNRAGETFPTEDLEVERCEKHTASDGTPCPKFTLLNTKTSERYFLIAWDRDVKACKEQWGNNPVSWERVHIAKDKGGKLRLMPSPMRVVEERVA